mmetsp:Transcript_71050/g.143018  ORF Transcript_71050/g.143018 Transcript_71050/m.143018 type:complete len:283 (+) Transcript_71050:113-961(+)
MYLLLLWTFFSLVHTAISGRLFVSNPVSPAPDGTGANDDEGSNICKNWRKGRVPWDLQVQSLAFANVKSDDPLSSSERLQHAWFNRGDMSMIDSVLTRLGLTNKNKNNITIAVVGGSMTNGHDLHPPPLGVTWSTVFVQNFRRLYPSAPAIYMWNMGAGSSSSQACVQSQIPQMRTNPLFAGLDLLIVDYGVNDAHITDPEIVAATEQMVNAVREFPSQPALLYLDTFRVFGNSDNLATHCNSFINESEEWLHEEEGRARMRGTSARCTRWLQFPVHFSKAF